MSCRTEIIFTCSVFQIRKLLQQDFLFPSKVLLNVLHQINRLPPMPMTLSLLENCDYKHNVYENKFIDRKNRKCVISGIVCNRKFSFARGISGPWRIDAQSFIE